MISREEWEAKQIKHKELQEKMALNRAEEGARLTAPLIEHAINLGLNRSSWCDYPNLFNREMALEILQKKFPEYKLDWWTGQSEIKIS